LSAKGATIELNIDSNRDDNLLFAEGGSRIIFSISKMKQNEWLDFLKQNQINYPSSVYVKKIGYVSSETLKIKIQDKNICKIRVEELSEKFNNSISGYFKYEKYFSTIKISKILSYVWNSWNRIFR